MGIADTIKGIRRFPVKSIAGQAVARVAIGNSLPIGDPTKAGSGPASCCGMTRREKTGLPPDKPALLTIIDRAGQVPGICAFVTKPGTIRVRNSGELLEDSGAANS